MDEKLFQVGVKGIIYKNNEILLLTGHYESSTKPVIDLPGGRIHKDDTTVEQTLLRELTEELPGISDIEVGQLIGATHMPKDFPGGIGWLLLYYAVSAVIPDPVRLTNEHEKYEWVTLDRVTEIFQDTKKSADFHSEMYEVCRTALE